MSFRVHDRAAAFFLTVLAAWPAQATNGYFNHGYGADSQSMGGVGYALPQDSLAVAANPAGLTLVGDRYDAGVTWFAPRRGAQIEGNNSLVAALFGGTNGSYEANGLKNFYIPAFGYALRLNQMFSVGAAMYGNGGMNTDYRDNPFGAFQLLGRPPRNAGVNLEQLFVVPSLSVRFADRQSIGLAPIFVYQLFKAYGLQAFTLPNLIVTGDFSSAPGNLTDRGYSRSMGFGYRIGYLAEPIKGLTVGASFQPKIHATRFDKYSGLFAGHGAFDVPASWGGGLAYRWHKLIVVSADIQRIMYHSVDSIGNSIEPFTEGGKKLGDDGGPGFGWRNMTIYKFGLGVRPWKPLLLMAGYSYGRQPVPQDQTFFNILAPGVLNRHYTAGAELNLGRGYELHLSYLDAPENTVYGHNSIPRGQIPPSGFGGGEANVRLKERAVTLALGVRF